MTNMLNILSLASRNNEDVIINYFKSNKNPIENKFDVFICYNSKDESTIKELNRKLKSAGVKTWLDKEQLLPGARWQTELQQQIGTTKKACVCIGEDGIGTWQNEEIMSFLDRSAQRNFPIIPIILPNVNNIPEIPSFLKTRQFSDLRNNYEDNLLKLIRALKEQ